MQYQSPSLWATPPPSTNDIHHLAHLDLRLPDRVLFNPSSGQRHLPSGKERDDAANSPSQGRRQSPNQPDCKVGILSTSNLTQTASNCLHISRCLRPPHLCQPCWTGLFGEAGFRELLLPGGSRRYTYRTSWSGLATSKTCNWCRLLLINREITDRGDELTVTVEMREEESRDITPPGVQRLWVFLNNEKSAHHAAGYIRTSAGTSHYPLSANLSSSTNRGLVWYYQTTHSRNTLSPAACSPK